MMALCLHSTRTSFGPGSEICPFFPNSFLPFFKCQNKSAHRHILHHHGQSANPVKQYSRYSDGKNFIKGYLEFSSLSSSVIHGLNLNAGEITHFNSTICHVTAKRHAQHTDNRLMEMAKQTLPILSMLLFTFLIQQMHLPTSSAIAQQPNSDAQSSQQRNQAEKDPEIMAAPDLHLLQKSGSVIDIAEVLSPDKATRLREELQALEENSGWKLRILTRSGPSPSPSDKTVRDFWQPDDKTIIVVEDISSPNVLNFGTGSTVASRLPRQFFVELQSRYGNQFFVSEEGNQAALLDTIEAIKQCIVKEKGCNNVPGLTNDLYFLTLATSIAGGSVFGFAARLPPQGRVEASWQWAILLSPLWMMLFVSFGILPIVSRTSDWDPVLKNGLGFLGAAAAFYLTPIFGRSPIGKKQ